MVELGVLAEKSFEYVLDVDSAGREPQKQAWIKAGRTTDEQFYAWSEKAREEKKKCDREIISLEDFQQWLRDSKI